MERNSKNVRAIEKGGVGEVDESGGDWRGDFAKGGRVMVDSSGGHINSSDL